VETTLGEAEVSSLQTRVPVRKGPNFVSDRWIDLKIIKEFSDAVFVGVDVESLLVEAEVLSLQTRRAFRKGHNFSSNRWITLKIIEGLPDAVFLGVEVETPHGECGGLVAPDKSTGSKGP